MNTLLDFDKNSSTPSLSSVSGATPIFCTSSNSAVINCSLLWQQINGDQITSQQINKKELAAMSKDSCLRFSNLFLLVT